MTKTESASRRMQACNCVGPQNGEPKCPCMMRNVIERDGRYIQKEVDLGPLKAGGLAKWYEKNWSDK